MKKNVTRDLVLQRRKQCLPQLQEKNGIRRIALYGSFARSGQTGEIDVDVLVDLSWPLGFEFVELAEDLEKILGK